jgi:hypothetical protein
MTPILAWEKTAGQVSQEDFYENIPEISRRLAALPMAASGGHADV